MANVFISYNYNDRDLAHNIYTSLLSGTHWKPVYVTTRYSSTTDIDRAIRNEMNNCEAALFIIGDNNHNSPWINREAELAISMGLRKVKVRYPNTYGGAPFQLNNTIEVNWDRREVNSALNRY